MPYNYTNEEMWTIKTTQKDFDNFINPYVGNGHMGTTFSRHIFSTSFSDPLCCISKDFYDDGIQIPIPSWNTIELSVKNKKYTYSQGKHELTQILDLRNGKVSMHDKWHYSDNEYINIEVQMIIPRQYSSGSSLSINISSVKEVSIKFGLAGINTEPFAKLNYSYKDNSIKGEYLTKETGKKYSQFLNWETENFLIKNIDKDKNNIIVSAKTVDCNASLNLFHSFSYNPQETVDSMINDGLDKINKDNNLIWKKIWDNAIAFETKFTKYTKMILVHQFYLFSSFSNEGNYAISPTGLSKISLSGVQSWDIDLFMFRAMLAINPPFAKSIIDFRYKTLDTAKTRAYIGGLCGAKYPWRSDSEGIEHTPALWMDAIHINIWIALAVWEYYLETKDTEYMLKKGYDIISNIADFLFSWANYETNNKIHMNMIVPPDEYVCERQPGRCNDNLLTHFGSKRVMETAIKCSELLGQKPKDSWAEFASNIFIPEPDEEGIIKEFRRYKGQKIKQADVIMAFYPLGFDATKDIIKKNLDYYHEKLEKSPIMTSQIENTISIKYLNVNKDEEITKMFEAFMPHISGPHYVVFERPFSEGGDNSVFLTAIGTELQALIYGYYDCTPGDYSKLPRIKEYN